MNQRDLIINAEQRLGVGPVELARRLDTPYATLRNWKSGSSPMPGAAKVALAFLVADKPQLRA